MIKISNLRKKVSPEIMNRYELKPRTTVEKVRECGFHEGGTWINPKCNLYKSVRLVSDISLYIGYGASEDWDDFHYIEVLDETALQPYFPFYGRNYGEKISNFEFLQKVIHRYNEEMDKLPFLQRNEILTNSHCETNKEAMLSYEMVKEYSNCTLWYEPLTDEIDGFVLRSKKSPNEIIKVFK